MGVCYVAGCPSRKSKTGRQFRIPKNASEEVRQAWIRNIPAREVPFDLIKHVLCEKHFEEELVESETRVLLADGTVYKCKKVRQNLKMDAIPTIFGNKVIGRRRIINPRFQKIQRKVTTKNRPAVIVPTVPENESLVKRKLNGYFCQLCLKVWYDETFQETLTDRQEAYSKFVERMTRHFQLEKVKGMDKAPVNFKTTSVFNNSLCNTCWTSSSAICKLRMELTSLEMKLDFEILKVTKMLQQPELIKKKEVAEKTIAAKSLHVVYKFNERLLTAGQNLASFPRVILKRVDDKTPTVQKQSENQMTISEPTVIPTVFYGIAGIRSLLGGVIRCKSCDKCFLSQMDLQSHQTKYHPKLPKPPVQLINRELNNAKACTHESNENKTCETVSLDTNKDRVSETEDLDFFEDDFSEIMDLDVEGDDGVCETVGKSQNKDGCHQNVQPNPVNPTPTSYNDQISLPTLVLNEKLLETTNSSQSSENNSWEGTSNASESRTSEGTNNVNEELQQEIKIEGSKKVGAPRKVPYMSSKFMGKYRVVCKLKNIQTGETCVGVIGKSNTGEAMPMPKVLSLGKFPKKSKRKPRRKPSHQPQLVKIPGPPFICPTPDCNKQFDQLNKCRRHWRHHLRKNVLKAAQAEKKQNDNSNNKLSKVKTVNEQKRQKLKCPVEGCCSTFNMKEALDCHLKTHPEHPCQFCDISFYDPGSLMSHEIQHKQNIKTISEEANTNNGIFECPRCEGAFKAYQYLKCHFVVKHLKVIVRSTGQLEAPMRTQSEETLFVCHVCGDAFRDRRLFSCHLAKKHPLNKSENH